MIIRIYFVSTSQVVLHPSKHSLGVNSNHHKKADQCRWETNLKKYRGTKSIENKWREQQHYNSEKF